MDYLDIAKDVKQLRWRHTAQEISEKIDWKSWPCQPPRLRNALDVKKPNLLRNSMMMVVEATVSVHIAKDALLKRWKQKREERFQMLSGWTFEKHPCIVCGDGKKVEAHHSDYSKPLDVDWLCSKHHALWHRHNIPYNGKECVQPVPASEWWKR